MLVRFAGFTYCDGFPFGGDDGAGSIILAFLIALAAIFIFPLPRILKKGSHTLHRQAIGLGGLILALSMVFEAANTRSQFDTKCENELQSYWAYVGSLAMPIIQAVTLAAIIGLIIKFILKAIVIGIRYVASIIRK